MRKTRKFYLFLRGLVFMFSRQVWESGADSVRLVFRIREIFEGFTVQNIFFPDTLDIEHCLGKNI